VNTASKRKGMEETPVATAKKSHTPDKRSKHHPPVVSPTQDLLGENTSQKMGGTTSRVESGKKESKANRAPSRARKIKGSMSTKECSHKDWADFKSWESQYFTSNHLKKRNLTNYPTECDRCKKIFVGQPGATFDKEKEFKVTNIQQVHLCQNATKDDHHCRYAVCQDCHNVIVKM
jgi:hypothetical protein